MTTIADELLNDFEDSGGEEEADDGLQQDGFLDGPSANGLRPAESTEAQDNGGMELDGDEEEVDDGEDMQGDSAMTGREAEDEEETKARVEKMQLGAVGDVRSVAGLMKTLEPVLEVSDTPPAPCPSPQFSFEYAQGVDLHP